MEATTRYPHLFSPLPIGPVTSRNRIIFGANFTMFTDPPPVYGEPGYYGERYAAYLGERAAGGAGVVIAGQTHVHPTTAYQMVNNAIAWDPAAIPGFRSITDAVHAHDALAFIQLAHNGGVNGGAWSKLPAWAPSDVANYGEPPKAMELHEIVELVEHFACSAANAAAGGFDGIEIHAAHGYLIHEFLSPAHNRRTDEYGGDLDGRMRFGVQVLRALREAVGPEVAVGLRLVGDERRQDGTGLAAADCAEIGARFDALGLVDFLDVSVGVSGIGMVRPLYAKPGFGVYSARAVKDALGTSRTPVFAVHRILMPDEAEEIIARGDADGVTLVRALIADPDWPNKARSGSVEEIRRCTGTNQGCYGNLVRGLPVSCVQNPAVGREQTLGAGTLRPASPAKRVVVIGGGPAGLEAAWVSAARGHDVTLLERSDLLGGKVHLAAMLPGRAELVDFANWRIGACERHGVTINLGTEADVATVLSHNPDAVIVATGGRAALEGSSKFHPMPVPGSEQPHVLDHETALREQERVGARVVILDAVGHIEGIGLAQLFAEAGREVTLVTPLPMMTELDGETYAAALPRAVRAGARWRPNTAMLSIAEGEVTLVDVLSFEMSTCPADTVVVRTHGIASASLYFELRDSGAVHEVLRVGDAVAVRFIDRAIFDGHAVGRQL